MIFKVENGLGQPRPFYDSVAPLNPVYWVQILNLCTVQFAAACTNLLKENDWQKHNKCLFAILRRSEQKAHFI